MKKIILSLIVLSSSISALHAQNNMVIHQGNGSTLSLPLQSIDSVRFNLVPPPAMKRIFQNNGNILSLSVTDIDSITYTIPNRSTLPTITTQAVTVLSSSSAFGGGNISADGGSAVTQRGVCWNTSPNPTIANNFTVDGTGLGSYGSTMQPLSPATTYYVRAYATNANGTSYGNEISFVTATANNNGNMPTISTNQVVYMDSLSAFCGGNITADGGLAVTARGVCWAVGNTPTINNSRTIDGAGGGNFNSRLLNLLPNTSYFVRAYATNAAGTAYGITYSFTTKGFATVATDSIFDIMALSVQAAGRVLSNGGVSVTERGFCWSYSSNPSVNDNKVLAGNGLGSFTQQIQSLFADTTIYIRTFAGSSIGFSYGNQISFRTKKFYALGNGVAFNDYTYTTIVLGNGQEWMAENLRTTKYRNGDTIPNERGNSSWSILTTGAWSHYTNNSQFESPYGKLYNWYAVADSRNVCPTGWHVPTDAEWTALTDYLGGKYVAGGKMKSTGTQFWMFPNTDATNESGFLGFPGGFRKSNGPFEAIRGGGYWWSSSSKTDSSFNAFYYWLDFYTGSLTRFDNSYKMGYSVRCIKD